MFSHFALISVELANSFWPRKLSAAPIRVFNYETLFEALVEHFIPRLQVVDEEETVRFPRRIFLPAYLIREFFSFGTDLPRRIFLPPTR